MAEGSGHDDLDDDLQLSELRAVFRSMRDEEPPARGLDALLAAAREKAAEMAPREAPEPWWRRLLASLTRPPVLALASVAILLGGALVLSRHKSELDNGLDNELHGAPVSEPAVAVSGESAAFADSENDTAHAPREESAAVEGAPEAPASPPSAPPPPADERGGSASAASGLGGTAAQRELAETARRQRALERLQRAQRRPTPASSTVTASSDEASSPPPAAPSQPLAKRESVKGDSQAYAPREEAASAPASAPSDTELERSIRRCLSLAEKGDCSAARALAAQIEKRDPAAYRARLATQPAIKRCLSLGE